tara:strand:- start:403 stop:1329 length:927 start_codon:yes stop_codon:yes gene_type:complete
MNRVDKIQYNPYNGKNVLVSRENIEAILASQEVIAPIGNLALYQQSFVHKSYCQKSEEENLQQNIELVECPKGLIPLQPESNERLEFLGDAVVNFVVGRYLYERYPDQDEGFMTRIRSKLVRSQALAEFATNLGLDKYLLISRHVEDRCSGRKGQRILEDVFESFIGAMYLDFNRIEMKQPFNDSKAKKESELEFFSGYGFHICELFLTNLIESRVDFTKLLLLDTNYKDQLLRYYQQHFQDTPRYHELSIDGPSHHRIFTMAVTDDKNEIIGKGRAASKKKAEQIASREALVHFGVSVPDSISDDSD